MGTVPCQLMHSNQVTQVCCLHLQDTTSPHTPLCTARSMIILDDGLESRVCIDERPGPATGERRATRNTALGIWAKTAPLWLSLQPVPLLSTPYCWRCAMILLHLWWAPLLSSKITEEVMTFICTPWTHHTVNVSYPNTERRTNYKRGYTWRYNCWMNTE